MKSIIVIIIAIANTITIRIQFFWKAFLVTLVLNPVIAMRGIILAIVIVIEIVIVIVVVFVFVIIIVCIADVVIVGTGEIVGSWKKDIIEIDVEVGFS